MSWLVRCSAVSTFGLHLCTVAVPQAKVPVSSVFVNAFFLMPSHAHTRKGVLLSAFRLSVFLPSALGGLSFLHFFASFLVLSSSFSFFASLAVCSFAPWYLLAALWLSFLFGLFWAFARVFSFVCGVSSVAPGCTRASEQHEDKEKDQAKTREPEQRAQQRQTTKAIKKNRPHTGIN
jgi:hypothetical protein